MLDAGCPPPQLMNQAKWGGTPMHGQQKAQLRSATSHLRPGLVRGAWSVHLLMLRGAFRLVGHVAHHLLLLLAVGLLPLLSCQIEHFPLSRLSTFLLAIGVAPHVGDHRWHTDSGAADHIPRRKRALIRVARFGRYVVGSQNPSQSWGGDHHLWHSSLEHFWGEEVLPVQTYSVCH